MLPTIPHLVVTFLGSYYTKGKGSQLGKLYAWSVLFFQPARIAMETFLNLIKVNQMEFRLVLNQSKKWNCKQNLVELNKIRKLFSLGYRKTVSDVIPRKKSRKVAVPKVAAGGKKRNFFAHRLELLACNPPGGWRVSRCHKGPWPPLLSLSLVHYNTVVPSGRIHEHKRKSRT